MHRNAMYASSDGGDNMQLAGGAGAARTAAPSTMTLATYLASQPVPFTLLAFRGADIVSSLIRVVEHVSMGRDEFSHIALVVTSECCPFVNGLQPGKAYVWESTFGYRVAGVGDGVPDITTGKHKFGVQIRDLEELVPAYLRASGTAVAVCPLLDNPWLPRRGESTDEVWRRRARIVDIMRDLHARYSRKMYELNLLEMLAAGLRCLRPVRDALETVLVDGMVTLTNMTHEDGTASTEEARHRYRTQWLWCAEFVCIVLQAIGVVPPGFKPQNTVACDFLGGDIDGMPAVAAEPVYITH